MRTPINPVPGNPRQRLTSTSVSFIVDVYNAQPGSPGADGTTPVGRLTPISGQLSDDASKPVQRTMTMELAKFPSWLAAGMWIKPTLGIQTVAPVRYALPTMVVTEVTVEPTDTSWGSLAASDPSEVVNGRPYEVDTALSGTLRNLVASACSLALTRATDVSGVPNLTIPADTIAEFGSGRWDVCIRVADSLGVALMFTDAGDVIGRVRADPYPDPVSIVELVGSSGKLLNARAPTQAKVFVDRGDTVGLIGVADTSTITGVFPPPWYRPYVVTDQVQGDATTTQSAANQLALDLLRQRLADLDTFDSMPVLGAPWLEAGRDVVNYRSKPYGVRSMTLELPSLATTLTIRRVF